MPEDNKKPNFVEMPEFTKEVDEGLNKFEQEMAGLPAWEIPEAPEYLYMPMAQLRKKTPDELTEAVIELKRYTLSIQRLINKHYAWKQWAEQKIDQVAADALKDISTKYGFQERLLIARNEPAYCKKLQEFLRETNMKLARLNGIPRNVDSIAEIINSLKFVALKREKEYQNGD